MGVQRYETAISENNLKHWGELEVLKEFVQNAVYAKTILGDKVEIGYDEDYAIIRNYPSGFDKGHLLIGESQQADVDGAPGQYGEGMKAAMAVSMRLGMIVTIQTNGFTIRPKLEPSSIDPNVRVLVFYVEDTDQYNGTTILVDCTEEKLDEACSYFAVLDGATKEQVATNTIIRGVPNTIFINGVKITESPSIFSYNFTDPLLMNRDRSSIHHNKLLGYVKRALSGLDKPNDIAQVIAGITSNSNLLESQSGILEQDVSDEHRPMWLRAVAKANGVPTISKMAISTGGDADAQARYRKFTLIKEPPYEWHWFYTQTLGIPYASDIARTADKPKRIHRKPDTNGTQVLGWAKRLVKLYVGEYGTVRVSKDLRDEYGNPCLGLYIRDEDVIWLNEAILSSRQETFKTLTHETLHRVTGAKDNTEAFTRAWEDACWGILTRGKGDM